MSTLGHERVGTAGLVDHDGVDLKSMISAAHAVNPDALEDPELRERIAARSRDIELTRLLNYRALTKIIKGQPNWPEVPLAKLQWSKISQTLAELAVDLLGRVGRARQGRPRRDRRRHLDPQLLLAALHLDRRRRDRDPEEHHRQRHHRQEGDQAPTQVAPSSSCVCAKRVLWGTERHERGSAMRTLLGVPDGVVERYLQSLVAHDWDGSPRASTTTSLASGPTATRTRRRPSTSRSSRRPDADAARVLDGGHPRHLRRRRRVRGAGRDDERSTRVALRTPECITFDLTADGRIARIEVFIQTWPRTP